MNLRAFIRERRQRRARKRFEREKAVREAQRDGPGVERVTNFAKDVSGGINL
jgi:hypothetical protein